MLHGYNWEQRCAPRGEDEKGDSDEGELVMKLRVTVGVSVSSPVSTGQQGSHAQDTRPVSSGLLSTST
jgi:hypothetical protein